MRLFVGVDLDEPVRVAAAGVMDRLRAELAHTDAEFTARWVPPANLHITLWFLGEVGEHGIAHVGTALQPPFREHSFPLLLRGVGAFPRSGPLRVLWIGAADGAVQMGRVYGELAERLERLGFPREGRPYSPHLTIARVKESGRGATRAIRQLLAAAPAECGTLTVNAVTLFCSRLSARGAVYEPLLRVPLV